MKNKLGILFTCYDEIEAVTYAIQQLRLHYPDTKIFLVTESKKLEYLKLVKTDKNIKINYVEDTMSFYYNNPNLSVTYQTEENQTNIKKAVLAFLDRLNNAIEYCDSEYMLTMDPDVLIRGKLNIPPTCKLLGSLTNCCVPHNIKNIISKIDGSVPIDRWGASPGIFHTETFKQAYLKFLSIDNLLDQLIWNWYSMYAHDIIIPIIFSLIGEREQYNTDFTECNTDINWEFSGKNLIHHFKRFYPNCKNKFPWWKD